MIDTPASLDDTSQVPRKEALRTYVEQHLQHDNSANILHGGPEVGFILQMVVRDASPNVLLNVSENNNASYRPMELRLRALQNDTEYATYAHKPASMQWNEAAREGFVEMWDIVHRQRELDNQNDTVLIKTLKDPEIRLRAFAIDRLGVGKVHQAVPALCAIILHESDPALVFKAIGSLVSIGDSRAVEPLIELAHQKEPTFVLQVVYAIGTIGGKTAEAYLLTLASGHPVAAVSAGAEDALTRMHARMQRSLHDSNKHR